MNWKQYGNLGAILEYHYESIEIDTLRYTYRILLLQIFLSMFYPVILYGDKSNLFATESIFKGITFLALAFRASYYQQREIFIFPEGMFGRLVSSCIPAFFIVAVYFSFDRNLGGLWLLWISIVMGIYLLKTMVIKRNLKKGNRFLSAVDVEQEITLTLTNEDRPVINLHKPLKTYRLNLFYWILATLIVFGFAQLLIYADVWLSSIAWHLIASIVYAGITCAVIIIYQRSSDLADHEYYIEVMNSHFLKEDAKPSIFN